MSTIIIGAGQIGQFIATKLSSENKDVTVIEKDEQKIAALGEKLDVRFVRGNGASLSVFKKAGIKSVESSQQGRRPG